MSTLKSKLILIFCLLCGLSSAQSSVNPAHQDYSAARIWMDAYLEAIKKDGLGPTIHARNMYQLSAIMYDTWLVYYPEKGEHLFLGKMINDFEFEFSEFDIPENRDSALNVSLNYAAYRFIINRFENYSSKVRVNDELIFLLEDLGLDPSYRNENYSSGSPAALGNYIANKMYEFGLTEPAGDEDGYEGPGQNPINPVLRPNIPGNRTLVDYNRWQPLSVIDYIKEKGWDSTLLDWNYQLIPQADVFLTPHWGFITPFAMDEADLKRVEGPDGELHLYNDPGPPPFITDDEQTTELEAYRWNHTLVSSWSGHNDPSDETLIDISPGSIGPTNGLMPNSFAEYQDFFDFENGQTKSTPHLKNPYTGKPYEKNLVKRGDYTRIIAEYWVDAVNTYSPPGHWVKMLNETSDSPGFEKKWGGQGEVLSNLEWDIKAYLTLTGALHDAAISAWSVKAFYDYIRPISAIRWMSDNGQCADSLLPRYHKYGLPLIEGKIELVDTEDPLAGENGENINKLKVFVWRGPDYVDKPTEDFAGVGWILAENWWPYQRYSFATPPFAGYVSGHSTFSIAASETMTNITGSPFFPGGLAEMTFKKNGFLEFEKGPSEDITLQWATYREAADETCLSRIWGGIHPPADDIEGRKIGEKVAAKTFDYVNELFNTRTR
jgi:hypothetical protein